VNESKQGDMGDESMLYLKEVITDIKHTFSQNIKRGGFLSF
jgi:hypothetical protein